MAADSLTPFLGLVKPVVGDEAGEDLWGDKLNANFDRIDTFASSQGVLTEAPDDGMPYARQSRGWTETATRAEVTAIDNKVTQNSSDLIDLDARMDANETIDTNQTNQIGSLGTQVGMQQSQIAAIESKNTSQDTAINGKAPLGPSDGAVYGWKGTDWFVLSGGGGSFTIDWNQVTGKPTTYPPTLPIPSSGVTGLDAKQTAQDNAIALRLTDSPNDGSQYARQSGNWTKVTGAVYVSDDPPAGALPNSLWWDSDLGALLLNYADPNSTQWVMINASGMPEANKDGKPYARKDGAWFDMSGYATQAWVTSQGYATTASVNNALANYVPLAGGTMSGALSTTFLTSASGVNVTAAGAYIAIQNGYASFVNNWSSSVYGFQVSGTAQLGGGLFYGAGNGYYAILGYGGYNVWGNSTAHFLSNNEVRADQYVRSMNQTAILVGHPTTTATATGYLNTGGTVYRSTSSASFKTQIEPMEDEYADKVLLLEPIFYRPGPMTSDPQDWSRFGLTAEQAHAVDFRFAITDRIVERTADGKKAKAATKPSKQPNPDHLAWLRMTEDERKDIPMPEPEIPWDEPTGEAVFLEGEEPVNIDLNGIVAALISVVKRQQARIQAMEARLAL